MTANELEALLHERIPISAAMGVRVVIADHDQVVLQAPFQPNVNPHGTAFGGSISTLALMAGWSMAYIRLVEHGYGEHVVIRHTKMDYNFPITGSFQAICLAPREGVVEKFVHHIERRGRGRIELKADVLSGGEVAATFHGEFVASSPAVKPALLEAVALEEASILTIDHLQLTVEKSGSSQA